MDAKMEILKELGATVKGYKGHVTRVVKGSIKHRWR